MTNAELDLIKKEFGTETAEELFKLVKNYDQYIMRLKSKLNKLLESHSIEAKFGVAFIKSEGETINGSTN